MKKLIAGLVILFMTAIFCLSQPIYLDDEYEYKFLSRGDAGSCELYYICSTAAELADHATHIYKGTVTGISFTAKTVSNEKCLYTVYEVQVQNYYKGIAPMTVYISVRGGLPGYQEDEQRKVASKYNIWVTTASTYRALSIGESYLFCTNGNGANQSIISPYQFVYSEESPNYAAMLQYLTVARWTDYERFFNIL